MNPHPQVLLNLSKVELPRQRRALRHFLTHGEQDKVMRQSRELYQCNPQYGKREPFNPLRIDPITVRRSI